VQQGAWAPPHDSSQVVSSRAAGIAHPGSYGRGGEVPDARGPGPPPNYGMNPTSVAVSDNAGARAGLAPAAGYAER
jgi:hypothetical protein